MSRIKLYKDNQVNYTAISNRFIDEYMKDANDAQIKVYLYLVRTMSAGRSTSISDIADEFNHTEKDVMRALKYWEKVNLLSLDFDESKTLIGIRIEDLNATEPAAFTREASPAAFAPVLSIVPRQQLSQTAAVSAPAVPSAPAKPAFTADELRAFKEREDTAQLLFIAESYLKRPLTASEMKSILYFSEVLHFSDDLIDYLIQYCIERGKKDFKYIEAVAMNWAEAGITTPKQAEKFACKYDKSVYAIMKALGKSSTPTSRELEYIKRWTKEYAFEQEVILEACERTVLATDKHRFEYAESILASWFKSGVRHKSDIQKMDELFQKKRSSTGRTGASTNKFNQFTQNDYDYDALEKELLSYGFDVPKENSGVLAK